MLVDVLRKASTPIIVMVLAFVFGSIWQITATRYTESDGEAERVARIAGDEALRRELGGEIAGLRTEMQAMLLQLARIAEHDTRDDERLARIDRNVEQLREQVRSQWDEMTKEFLRKDEAPGYLRPAGARD